MRRLTHTKVTTVIHIGKPVRFFATVTSEQYSKKWVRVVDTTLGLRLTVGQAGEDPASQDLLVRGGGGDKDPAGGEGQRCRTDRVQATAPVHDDGGQQRAHSHAHHHAAGWGGPRSFGTGEKELAPATWQQQIAQLSIDCRDRRLTQ